MFGGPHPNGKLEILYQLYDETPSYYQEQAKAREDIIQKADPKDFKAAFDTVMDSNENNIFRCISIYTMNKIYETNKINDFLLQTRNDYLPLYLLNNLNFQTNIDSKSRFGIGYPYMIDLGYPSVSRFLIFLYNLNPTWPELISIIKENVPTTHYILVYFHLNMPLSITIPAFEGIMKDIRTLPSGFNEALYKYKEKFPIELIAKYIGSLKYCFFTHLSFIFVRYHNEIISNKNVFTTASTVSILLMLLRYEIYTPFDVDFDKTIKILTEHFCVIDGEQRGYSNPSVYTEFRIYLKKVSEMYPDKYSKFLSGADETVLSAFSFEYNEEVAKRIFENSYCPFVYVVLFHDKIPKSIVPFDKLDMFEPAPDLVNSIKLYNGIDENLMKEYLNKMSVAKFVYLFHDYYDCKSIPDLKDRLLNGKRDYDSLSILFDAILILGDAVDVSKEIGKFIRYGRISDFAKLANQNLFISKEDVKYELSNDYFLKNPFDNSKNVVTLIRKMLSDYPEFVNEYKEKLQSAYYAPLFLKDFVPSYEYDQLNPEIVIMLANENGVKSLSNEQVELLISLSIKDFKHKNNAFKAVSDVVFNLELNVQLNKISQAIVNLIENFIICDDNYWYDELAARIEFIKNLKMFLNSHSDVRQQVCSILPKQMENVFDYIETIYKIKV